MNNNGYLKSLGGIAAYYVLLLAAASAIMRFFPDLWPTNPILSATPDIASRPDFGVGGSLAETDLLSAALSTLGALILVIPVAWMYTITKRKGGYDSSVVQTVLILPVAVAGIVMIVQHSIALAFSLAGIVAAVRFRNTLKDTRDAVYIFLAIGVGLAAGVQAHSVALVMSIIFNLVVFFIWQLGIGEPTASADAIENNFNGILTVRAKDPLSLQEIVENILDAESKDWRVAATVVDTSDSLEYLIRSRKRTPPDALVNLITHRVPPGTTIQFTSIDG